MPHHWSTKTMQAKLSNIASGIHSCLGPQTINTATPVFSPIERLIQSTDGTGQRTPSRTVFPFETETSGPEGLLHDVRNLLGAIALYADLLSIPGVLRAEHRGYADELRHIGSRSQALVERLLFSPSASAKAGDIPATQSTSASVT